MKVEMDGAASPKASFRNHPRFLLASVHSTSVDLRGTPDSVLASGMLPRMGSIGVCTHGTKARYLVRRCSGLQSLQSSDAKPCIGASGQRRRGGNTDMHYLGHKLTFRVSCFRNSKLISQNQIFSCYTYIHIRHLLIWLCLLQCAHMHSNCGDHGRK